MPSTRFLANIYFTACDVFILSNPDMRDLLTIGCLCYAFLIDANRNAIVNCRLANDAASMLSFRLLTGLTTLFYRFSRIYFLELPPSDA